ncbi:MAG: DUF4469 domain-containing protein [Tannerellaceae bacterium]|jgi:hypothetical protein|nr:DUF4469 domain-containing protein [Tannerellaceae bacterium]
MKRFYWKAWLRQNFLTKDVDNDYVAEVSTVGRTLRNSDIAQEVVKEGSEVKYETVFDIVERTDRIRREKLQEGCSVQTGICHLSPRITGNWIGASTAFDPEKHKSTLDITPTAEMRSALAEVGVEVLGIREGGAYIGLVTDVTTGLVDGTITPNGQILIAGEKIKVEPSTGAGGVGVFVTDGKDTHQIGPLAVNHPKEIISVVPPLSKGTYQLYILTRYTSGGDSLLNEPRRIEYATPLVVTE